MATARRGTPAACGAASRTESLGRIVGLAFSFPEERSDSKWRMPRWSGAACSDDGQAKARRTALCSAWLIAVSRLAHGSTDSATGSQACGTLVSQVTDSRPCQRVAGGANAVRSYCNWLDDDDLEWDTQIVYLTHHTHERLEQSEITYERLRRAGVRAKAYTVANARSSRILTGIGLCHRRAGRYAAGDYLLRERYGILSRSRGRHHWRRRMGHWHLATATWRHRAPEACTPCSPARLASRFLSDQLSLFAYEACYLLGDFNAARVRATIWRRVPPQY